MVNFGQKPVILMNFKNINKRALRHYNFLKGLTNPIVEALKYQECFHRTGFRTKGELKKLGIKRGRNTIKRYMLENGLDPAPQRYEDSWDAYIKRTFETL